MVAFAKASGFQIISGNLEGRDLRLTGTVANIEKTFHVTMGLYKDLTEDRTFFAVDREPTVDLPFQLWHISGLDNDSKPHPMYVKKSDYANAIINLEIALHVDHGVEPAVADDLFEHGSPLEMKFARIQTLSPYGFNLRWKTAYNRDMQQAP